MELNLQNLILCVITYYVIEHTLKLFQAQVRYSLAITHQTNTPKNNTL